MNSPNEPTFGRYVVMERAGEGSLGEVFKARHQELGRLAAVKVLKPEVRSNPAAVAGMVAEASTLVRLDHPNIVALYDFVQEPDRTWLAEQWVDGAPLDRILAQHRRLTPEQALGVLTGALSGLAHAHDHGVVHRDVAASNVLADMAGTSMLVDFGLASPIAGQAGQAGVLGTPAYLSPEAARGEPVGKQGDVYSAAALTYQLLSGLPVFPGTPWEMVAAHRDRPAPPLDGHGPRLTALLERSLAKDVAQRPPDARAFLVELEQAAEEKYGAAWRSRAAIAGLVAATAAGGAAVVASGAGATVVAHGLPPAVTATTQVAVKTGRRVAPKLIAAGGAAVVAAAAVVTAVVLTSSDDEPDASGASPTSTAPSSLSPEEIADQQRQEKQDALETAVPDGRYWFKWENVSTQRDGTDLKPDRESGGPWRFDASGCTASRCQGAIDAGKGGADLTFTWDGTTLDISRDPTVEKNDKEACVDTVTGETLPIEESAARWTAKYSYPPVPLRPGPDGSLPATFSVTRTAHYTWEFFGTCEKGPQDIVLQRSTWTFSRHK